MEGFVFSHKLIHQVFPEGFLIGRRVTDETPSVTDWYPNRTN